MKPVSAAPLSPQSAAVSRLRSLLRLVFVSCLMLTAPAWAKSFIVNIGATNANSNDLGDANPGDGTCADINGKCSLRAAIQEGNALASATPHTITFSVPTVRVINGSLPTLMAPFVITGPVIINGTGNVSAQGCLSLSDSGTPALGYANGATGSTITLLSIGNCSGDGISANGHGYTFVGNFIGVDPTGLIKTANAGHGISLSSSHVYNNVDTGSLDTLFQAFPSLPVQSSDISTFANNLATTLASLNPDKITGNVISGNGLNGIELFSENQAAVIVSGNMIGTDLTGNVAIANGGSGIHLTGSTFGNLIGPNNVISGNTADGIRVESGTVYLPNYIMGNRIGLASTIAGQHIGNGGNGIFTDTKPDGSITNKNPTGLSLLIGPGNLISDNQGGSNSNDPDTMGTDFAGIQITGASNSVKVVGNTIGMAEIPLGNALASRSYGNHGDGILVTASGNAIGGSAATSSNTIAANTRHGIVVRLSNTTSTSVLGNSIGMSPAFANNLTFGNGFDGIHIDGASSTTIGGSGASDFNVIAANGRNGIALRNGNSANGWSNLSQRNQIFGNAKGNTAALPVALPVGVGVGIDLDHNNNVADDLHTENFPSLYSNQGQSQAVICTGASGEPAACAGFAAPASAGGNTTFDWTITTHGPGAIFRVEFFKIDTADDNTATSMSFLAEQQITTDASGLPTGAGCAGGRCSATIAASTGGNDVLMTVTDISPLTDQPGMPGDWKAGLLCFAGNLGVIPMTCTESNTSEFSNVAAIALSNNAALSNLSVSSGTLTPVFAMATMSYTDTVANAVSSITVTPTVADSTATVKVNGTTVSSGNPSGAIVLNVGSNMITVLVTAQDGTTMQTYTINVTRAGVLSNVASLSNLSISSGSLTPAFLSTTLGYTDAVANAITSVTVTPTVTDANATVKVNGTAVTSGNASGAITLNVGANAVTVLVTAQDGTTTQTYTINVTRAGAMSNVASLNNLSVSSGSLTPAFLSTTLGYTDAVANAITSVTVTPTTSDANATVKVNGTTVTSGNASGAITLNVGANAVTVLVTAQDGTTTQTYTINVTRAGVLSNIASLSNLSVSSGSLTPAFLSTTLGYTDAVANAITSVTVTPTVTDANATVKVNGTTVTSGNASGAITLNVGANAVTVLVTAQDGTTTQTYTINVTRAGVLSNVASLSNLSVSSGTLTPAFLSTTLGYTDAVANAITSVTVTPTTSDANATVKVNGTTVTSGNASGAITLNVGANAVTVLVTAQDGTTTQTYTISVTRAGVLSNIASLNNLSVSTGSLTPAFLSTTLGYTDAVANAITSVTVTPTVTDANATVKVNGTPVTSGNASGAITLNIGANAVTVLVTAQDGATMQTYTINVTRAGVLSNVASLGNLSISSGSLTPAFLSTTLGYTDAVANAITSVTVTPTVTDSNATVKVNGTPVTSGNASGAITLNVGVNAITVLVTAQDGTTTQTYTISVTRAGVLSNIASLSNLSVSSGSLTPAFLSTTLGYTDAVANAITSVTVTPTVTDANATVKVNGTTVTSGNASGAITLNVGANAVTVLVTAQDGTTTQTYTISVTRAGAAVVTTYTGMTSTNTGIATAVLSGGGASCSFGTTAFVGPPVPAPVGVTFPDGLFDFTAVNCTGSITVTVTFPTAFSGMEQYWKYGPTPGPIAAHWYTLGATNNLSLSGKTATFTINDGGLGDDDLSVNTTIVDQGGPGVPVVTPPAGGITPAPALNTWALVLLCGLVGGAGFAASRNRAGVHSKPRRV